MRISGIGSRAFKRELDPLRHQRCVELGAWAVRNGHIITTGNAPGIDQAFAEGGNLVDPTRVHLNLPWYKFERDKVVLGNVVRDADHLEPMEAQFYSALAEKHHKYWQHMKWSVKKLMTRNAMILMPTPYQAADLCLAYPQVGPKPGGTGHGMRISRAQGVELVDLNFLDTNGFYELCERLRVAA